MVDRVSQSPSRLPIPKSKASPKVLKNGRYGSDIVTPLEPPDESLIESNGKENGLSSDLGSKESSLKCKVPKPNIPSELLLHKDKAKKHTEKGFETFLMTGDMIIKTNPSLKLRKMDGGGLERHHSDSSNPFEHDLESRTFKRSASSPDQTTFSGANLDTEFDNTCKTSPEEDSDENSIDKKAISAESGFEEQAVHSDTGTLEKRDKSSNDPTSVSDLSELESDDMLGTMIESQSSVVSSNISTVSTPSDLRSDVSVNTVLQQEVEPLINDDSSSSSSIEISSADSESGELSPEVIFERSMSDSGGMSPVSQTDVTKYLMASKSAEKIVIQKQNKGKIQEPQLVRASKSHENYFSDEVTFVNIDIEDTAYSLDQIPCQVEETPTKDEPNFYIQSDNVNESSHPSDNGNRQETKDERIFMPGFIKLEDSVEFEQESASDSGELTMESESIIETTESDSFSDISDIKESRLKSVHSDMHDEADQSVSFMDNENDFHVSEQVQDLHNQSTGYVQEDLFALPPAKSVDLPSAKRLAKRLYNLDGFRKSDVSRHLSKKNDFSTIVAEEYLKFFDFASDTLDVALRKFLKQFSLIGETQERERVLAHFSRRYLQSNPGSFNSEDACHTLVCALMLLNTDLHGQAVGRKMTCGDFIENLSGLNDGDNFPKEILKALYYAIKADPIEWAHDEEFQDVDRRASEDQRSQQTSSPSLPSLPQVIGRNPFLDIPDPSQTTEYKKGYMMRKCCIDPDGRKTAVGKRGWKMFYVVLRDMIIYLYKDEQGMKKSASEGSHNAIRVHHSLASKAADYTKKQHVLRLQTADWAEYLFQTSNSKELQEWIDTLNYVAASLSAPPLPGAVGSQKKFQRPLLPASYTRLNLSEQLHSLEERLSGTKLELQEHRTYPPEKGSKASVIQHFLEKENYLVFEISRLETYIYLLQSKLASHTELEPSLVETSIGEEEEGIKGVNNHATTKKSPAQKNSVDRFSCVSNQQARGDHGHGAVLFDPSQSASDHPSINSDGLAKTDEMWGKKYGKVFGYYQGMRPNVAVTDPELIKKILVKNFTNFSNRPSVGNVPKLIGESIFFMKDRLWKRTRNIITPTFSSGKLKNMVPIINRCAGLLTDNLLGHEGESVVVRKYFGQFTMDTITATAFGLEINSQKDPDNPFLKHMTGILTPSLLGRMGFILSAMFPGIGQVLIKIGISGWPKESVAFYTDTGKRLIDERKSSTTEYNDFMYLLINAEMDETKSEHIQNGYKIGSLEEKGKIMKLSDDEIISQSFLFFIAGYETTSSLLRYAAYILATKPEIDDKLYDEINEYIGMDEPTYDNIGKLKYMEQFIYETLRFYPPAPRLNRVAQEDIDLDGKIIPKGSTIAIPVYGIHHNEEYYPDPETFDPERFPPDKKISTDSTTFLAFGAGPRHCIGTRLAIIEAKIALVHLLRKMKFVKSERTQEKLELTHLGLLRPTQPIEVKIDKR